MFVSTDEMCQGCVWGYQKIKGEKNLSAEGREMQPEIKGNISAHQVTTGLIPGLSG